MSCETKKHGEPAFRFLRHPLEAALLERDVADREDLVGQQDVRLHVDGDGEGQAQVHAARVVPERVVHELLELGELDDVVQPVEHFAPRDARASPRS